MSDRATVQPGDTIVFEVNGGRQALVTLDAKSEVKLGKTYCAATPIVGSPYGSLFALGADGKTLERIKYTPPADWELATPQADFNARSNAELVDNGGAQALSTADIEAMKARGSAGAEIVAALAANSATFAAKTEFSQDKYRKKKARKYIQIATVRRPTAAAVCEALFAASPAKTAFLRADALALLLSLANVGAHARVLVVERCGGLVSAAVAERLGARGCVASAWAGGTGTKQPSLALWRHFNLSPAQCAAMRFAPLNQLLAEQQHGVQPGALQTASNTSTAQGQQAGAARCGQPQVQREAPVAAQPQPAGLPPPQQPHTMLHAPFNSCILADASLSPLALMRCVLPLLAPSAAFAIFCPWQQPLAEAMDALRGQRQVAGLTLHEPWWREMQVLPLRTHPNMNMNHGGGFILSGTIASLV